MTPGQRDLIDKYLAVIASLPPERNNVVYAAIRALLDERDKFREIVHLVWHCFDDSEERKDEIVIPRGTDFERLMELLPEEHPTP
jgi:hypothetical protein